MADNRVGIDGATTPVVMTARDRVAADLAGRGADDLSAVNTTQMPVETHALGVALNGLLSRRALDCRQTSTAPRTG